MKILQEGREKALAMKELILQPQSEIAEFRQYLRENGYHIIKEDMVFEDGKYYPMMKAVPEACDDCMKNKISEKLSLPAKEIRYTQNVEETERIFDLYGQYLLEHRHPILKQYLEHSESVTETLIDRLKAQASERAKIRLPELEEELILIRSALQYFKDK